MTGDWPCRRARLLQVLSERPGIREWRAAFGIAAADGAHRAGDDNLVLAVELTGFGVQCRPGQDVWLNALGPELGLGTGGTYFVLPEPEPAAPAPEPALGHLVKLRYTPWQFRILAAEEEASPHHGELAEADDLAGTPVIALGLHSQLLAAAAGCAAAAAKAAVPLRVAYVMTDDAALPIRWSRDVAAAREAGLIQVTLTAGHAFGGDLEVINVHSGLLAARLAARAQVIIAGPGPGLPGTGTRFGHGGVGQGVVLNAAASLGGRAIAALRLSTTDPRPRHLGLSHHARVALGRVALAPVSAALPSDSTQALMATVHAIWEADASLARHALVPAPGLPGIDLLGRAGIGLSSMGRTFASDPAPFLSASAAGFLACCWSLSTSAGA